MAGDDDLVAGGGIEAMCAQALEEPYDEMLLEHFYFVRAMLFNDKALDACSV